MHTERSMHDACTHIYLYGITEICVTARLLKENIAQQEETQIFVAIALKMSCTYLLNTFSMAVSVCDEMI